jgi:hypothetical protein
LSVFRRPAHTEDSLWGSTGMPRTECHHHEIFNEEDGPDNPVDDDDVGTGNVTQVSDDEGDGAERGEDDGNLKRLGEPAPAFGAQRGRPYVAAQHGRPASDGL